MYKKFLFICFLLIFSSSFLYAETSYPKVKQSIKNKQSEINTLIFDFEQSTFVSSTNDKSTAFGKVIFKTTKNLYIEYIKPFKQKFIANALKTYLYNIDQNQVIIQDSKNANKSNEIAVFDYIFNFTEWEKKYEDIFVGDEQDQYVIIMSNSPKDSTVIYVSKNTFFPNKIEIQAQDIKIITIIKNIKENEYVEDKLFEFVVPKGASVWEE